MRSILKTTMFAAMLTAIRSASWNLEGAAIGAGTGAVIAGPVGAVAGGVLGGPDVMHRHRHRHGWINRNGYRRCG